MRILLVPPVFYPHRSGAVTQVHKLAKTLQSHEHYVEILTAYPSYVGFCYYDNILVNYSFSISPDKAYNFSPTIIAALIRKRKFDLVHTFDYQSFPAHFIALSRSLFSKKTKLCFSPQYHQIGGTPFRTALRLGFKVFGNLVFHEADRVICISHYELKNLLSAFRIPERKLAVIPLGIDLKSKVSPRVGDPSRGLQLIYVGRLEKYKGVHLILEALSLLADKSIKLSIIGRGSYEDELRKMTQNLDLGNSVSFQSGVSDKELDCLYRKSDSLILPSLFESFGLTIAEAMSYGKPVISTNVGFMYDLCQTNKMQQALLLPMPPTSEAIADKIRFLLNSPVLAQKIAARNLEILSSVYSWEKVSERIESMYTLLTGKN
jgi:glycosyltransferase involved in cell wall biosynthesis